MLIAYIIAVWRSSRDAQLRPIEADIAELTRTEANIASQPQHPADGAARRR
jgi:hypothetical protein